MKIIYNNLIPVEGFKLINLWGLIFARYRCSSITPIDENHERIHTHQIVECTLVVLAIVLFTIIFGASCWWLIAVIPAYYALYLLAWALAGFRYREICFETEAYKHQADLGYLSRRKPFAWLKYVFGAE